ncbi:type 2 isopentenyl-diphosphate Delta-isomerase [Acrocarpospora catenulata]|uniref:type 2 isopentenyl-diphosphate Delta-isomerase n=1 Tax=Acrocarpospora catenulata TaxID=2836182 RepID=UPI001BDB444C|nr:type 2 isopentenyl-diphosphate Delta-isomerase [Acrocarpospora catenulata]
MTGATGRRKDQHLDLCVSERVEPTANGTLLDCVDLVHSAMPELSVDDINLESLLFGRRIKAPLVITGMTGGTPRGAQVNRDLASVAQHAGVAFGVGSQRAMAEDPSLTASYRIRDVAPSIPIIGNIGLRQADQLGADGVARLKDAIDADGMALHLNVAQELTQPEGDRDFRGGYALVERLVQRLEGAVLVKETGCGISPAVARRLIDCGVTVIDVSGAGGTSWVRVEQLRTPGNHEDEDMARWGIPTAAATLACRNILGEAPVIIASGGIRTGLDAARALALGADLVGMALPLLRAWDAGGAPAATEALDRFIDGIRHVTLLTGCAGANEIRHAPKLIRPPLTDWQRTLVVNSIAHGVPAVAAKH